MQYSFRCTGKTFATITKLRHNSKWMSGMLLLFAPFNTNTKYRRSVKTLRPVRLYSFLATNIHCSLSICCLFVFFSLVHSLIFCIHALYSCRVAPCIHQENTNYIVAYKFKQSENRMERKDKKYQQIARPKRLNSQNGHKIETNEI